MFLKPFVAASLVAVMAKLAEAQSVTESPASGDCSLTTTTVYGIDTSIASYDLNRWLGSVNTKYYTEGHTWSGTQVPVFTDTPTLDGTAVTAFAYLRSDILEAEGIKVVSSVTAVTTCGTAATATCSPHIDHWHCPPGVEEPDYAPGEEEDHVESDSDTECVAHIDHWHCPEGVDEPTYPPDAIPTSDMIDSDDSDEVQGESNASGAGVVDLAITMMMAIGVILGIILV